MSIMFHDTSLKNSFTKLISIKFSAFNMVGDKNVGIDELLNLILLGIYV